MPTTYRAQTVVWVGPDDVVYTSNPPNGSSLLSAESMDVTIPEYTNAGVPTTQFNGVALPEELCIDTTNNNLYRNAGTQAVNVWAFIGAKV